MAELDSVAQGIHRLQTLRTNGGKLFSHAIVLDEIVESIAWIHWEGVAPIC